MNKYFGFSKRSLTKGCPYDTMKHDFLCQLVTVTFTRVQSFMLSRLIQCKLDTLCIFYEISFSFDTISIMCTSLEFYSST